ncbi:hypothetical protein CFI00_20655 [Nocardioides sp. S5]|uniref:hypothetical protein n=1 Tax=Nocardioides sp. S5 TaxID=2017486 RepID=UPI001A8C1A50|nr:hypothetical protein [Nocardioides sp. S5]QSR32866.1 hypothetical protein CFI00_20655 [Nocardioides sp. S5]
MTHVQSGRGRLIGVVLAGLLATTLSAAPTGAATAQDRARPSKIGAEFFGMDISIGSTEAFSWPQFTPGAVRIHLAWNRVERSPGTFDWTETDAKIAIAEAHGAKPLLVIVDTPIFHTSYPAHATNASPPRLHSYGRFVRRLAARYGDRVDYQVWNEPNVPLFYTGTPAHAAKMTKIAGKSVRKFAPGATVVAPSFTVRHDTDRAWFKDYWSQRLGRKRVADFVDAANISAYPFPEKGPEQGLALAQWAQRAVAREGFDGPLWASEINYGANGLAPTPRIPARRQAAFVVQTYVLHAADGAERVYWWRWEGHQTVNTQLQDGEGGLTRAGVAYGVVKGWLLGTKPKGCSWSAGVRTCRFRARGGVDRVVVWSGSGKRRAVRAPVGAVTRTSASGAVREIGPGRFLRVGRAPVMIEVMRS